MKVLIIFIICYLLFLYDFEMEISYRKMEFTIIYHGLVWVVLDWYTIKKYKSNDKPMKFIKIVLNQ